MDKNRIEGAAEQGERARSREALVVKAMRRRSGGRAVKECVLTWGDIALQLKGRRRKPAREVATSDRWSKSKSSGSSGEAGTPAGQIFGFEISEPDLVFPARMPPLGLHGHTGDSCR